MVRGAQVGSNTSFRRTAPAHFVMMRSPSRQIWQKVIIGIGLAYTLAGSAFTSLGPQSAKHYSMQGQLSDASSGLITKRRLRMPNAAKQGHKICQQRLHVRDGFSWMSDIALVFSILVAISFTPVEAAHARGAHIHPHVRATQVLPKKMLQTSVIVAQTTNDIDGAKGGTQVTPQKTEEV